MQRRDRGRVRLLVERGEAAMPTVFRFGDQRPVLTPWRVATVLFAAILPVLWLWWARLAHPSDGTLLLPVPGADRSYSTILQVYGHGSALRAGDQIASVDGVNLSGWVVGAHRPVTRHVGDLVTYTVRRHGTLLEFPVRLERYPFISVLRDDAGLLALVVFLLVLGSAVFLLRPFDPAARAMFLVGAALPLLAAEYPAGLQVIDLAGGSGVIGYLGADLAAVVVWGGLLYFALVFPEPVPALRRRPWLGALALICPILLWLASWSWALPTARSALARFFVFLTVSATASRVVPILAGARLLISFRSTNDPDVRRRLRWIMVCLVAALVTYLALGVLPSALGHGPLIPFQWLFLVMLPAPLAFAAAILRYRIFDIEVILTRSLLLGTLTFVMVAAYAAAILLMPRIQFGSSTLTPLLVGSAIAVVAFVLRRRLARRITSLVYGDRNDPHAILARLGEVNTGADAASVLPDVVRTLATALRLPYVRLELLGPDGVVEADAEFGRRQQSPTTIPIGQDGEVLARLELDAGPGREPFGPADQRLLTELTQQLTGAARTLLLARALQRSRERLVLAREEERRRLRHDLHDGIGPALAAQAMQLEVASNLMARDPPAAGQLLAGLGAASHELIAEVRRIVEDLRPATIDQLGLVSAIREQVRPFDGVSGADHPDGFLVSVEADGELGELPAAVEVAAFRIAVEAVTNAARYSQGSVCTIRLERAEELRMTVTDNGRGLQREVAGSGIGIRSMRERALELGGSLTVRSGTRNVGHRSVVEDPGTGSGRGPGTVVDLRLPLHG